MHDRPTAEELVAAVGVWLEGTLLPALTDQRLRFQARVAMHALSIVGRQLPREEDDLRTEVHGLATLLGWRRYGLGSLAELREQARAGNLQLCERIRAGDFDSQPQYEALVVHLRAAVERKLEVCQPR